MGYHVGMFVRVKATAKPNKKKVQICESIRQGAKVKQVIVRHVGVSHNEQELDNLKRLAKVLMAQIKEERRGPLLFSIDDLDSQASSEDSPALVVPETNSTEQGKKTQEKQRPLIVDLNDLSEMVGFLERN